MHSISLPPCLSLATGCGGVGTGGAQPLWTFEALSGAVPTALSFYAGLADDVAAALPSAVAFYDANAEFLAATNKLPVIPSSLDATAEESAEYLDCGCYTGEGGYAFDWVLENGVWQAYGIWLAGGVWNSG